MSTNHSKNTFYVKVGYNRRITLPKGIQQGDIVKIEKQVLIPADLAREVSGEA